MKKIIPIIKQQLKKSVDLDDKHLAIMQAILPYAKPVSQKNLTDLVINRVTRKTKIRLFLLPEWAINFPPYNLARLVSVCKQAGFQADAVDLNINAFRDYKNWNIDFDPWHGSKEWRWMGESYKEHLHKYMSPLIEKQIEKIYEDKIDVIGFSLYYCNQEPTDYMASEIKKRYPHVKILVGGPQCHAFPPGPDKPFYDYVVSGEGEQMLLDILDQIENESDAKRNWIQSDGERLNLDNLPWADYSHFDLSKYLMPNGVNAEFSRGCVAKCVFCSETHFWKYRGRSAYGILEEIINLYNNYGIDYIWFLDSLVNGNIKELRAFCKGIIASGIKINWTGYARCDKRMDYDYYKDLSDSGCKMLSYGIESGSNKVLIDMDKKVDVQEIEENLYHGSLVGIQAHTNWIVGFPTEQLQDIYESMTLIYRNRLYIDIIAAGHGFTEPPDTILSQNSEKFGMIKAYYMDNWITGDFKNSKVHRVLRLLFFNIFLDITPGKPSKIPFFPSINFSNFDVSKYYKIRIDDRNTFKELNFKKIDFNLVNELDHDFKNSVINEIIPLLKIIWYTRGSYSIQIDIDREKLMNEFGTRLACDITARYKFTIDKKGNWKLDLDFKFFQDDNSWRIHDYSREDSMSARRARTLAIPESNGDVMWTKEIYDKHHFMVEELKLIDFSFALKDSYSGQW